MPLNEKSLALNESTIEAAVLVGRVRRRMRSSVSAKLAASASTAAPSVAV